MGALICFLLRTCKSHWLFDVMVKDGNRSMFDPLGQHPRQAGVYQCQRCKKLRLGGAREHA